MRSVDLNCDCGEGFGAYRIGDGAAMLDIVTSVNVACGFHAGDPEIMAQTFGAAKAKGIAIGAHPDSPISGGSAAADCHSRREKSSCRKLPAGGDTSKTEK
jgi:lactam utilization protein B